MNTPILRHTSSGLCLDAAARSFYVEGKLVTLRNKEFSLLEYLMGNPNRVLSRTQILEDVWDRNIFCATNTVDVHVSRLRTKLFDLTRRRFIRTVHSIGYAFTADA